MRLLYDIVCDGCLSLNACDSEIDTQMTDDATTDRAKTTVEDDGPVDDGVETG